MLPDPVQNTASDVAGVLLAGGRSSRMGGGDKGLLDIAGRPMLAHVIERLKPQVGPMVINANCDPGRFARFGLPVVSDTVGGFAGPLAGVLAGMRWAVGAAPRSRTIVTVSTDAPFLPRDLVARLRAAVADRTTAVALASSGGELHPVIGLWPVALRHDLRRALVDEDLRKIEVWTQRHGIAVATWPVDPVDPFFNVNTPEDAATATRLAAAESA